MKSPDVVGTLFMVSPPLTLLHLPMPDNGCHSVVSNAVVFNGQAGSWEVVWSGEGAGSC